MEVAAPAAVQAEASSDESEQICRYCFEGSEGGELISPCACSGGQKYVHLKCLRMWQRAVLVSQPTHPDLYSVDSRQRICNVCKTEFTCAPPTRTELMASITGPEIAALIDEGCLIASALAFSRELEQMTADYPEVLRERIVDRNWIRGVFLITKVTEERKRETVLLRLDDGEDLRLFLEQIGDDARTLQLRGRTFCVLLRGVANDASPAARREALQALQAPVTLRLRPAQAGDCGEDGVQAVNLARRIDLATARTPRRAHRKAMYTAAQEQALESGCIPRFEVDHFFSGPCEDERVSACLVLTQDKYSVIQGSADCLEDGIREAQRVALEQEEEMAAEGPEPSAEGAAGAAAALALVRGSEERAAGEGQSADPKASESPPSGGLGQAPEAGSGKELPQTPEAGDGEEQLPKRRRISAQGLSQPAVPPVRLYVCWGYAGWSRCQLMGEIARQSWGLCRSVPQDVLATSASALWDAVYPRLLFAPQSEMSEHQDDEALAEGAERRQQLRQMAIFHEILRGTLPVDTDADTASLEVLREIDEESGEAEADEESDEAEAAEAAWDCATSSSESSSSDDSSS